MVRARVERNVKRTVTRLADGRELIYFDERDDVTDPDGTHPDVDRRDLPPPPAASELRYDALLDEWVTVAAHRQTRTFLPPSHECPLCPSTAERATEIPSPWYDVVVFENRFPSFSDRHPDPTPAAPTPLAPVRPGDGRCEVVCFTSDHDTSFAALPVERAGTVLAAWIDRTAELSGLPGVEQVMCFENRGEAIGVTLHHAHGQIYAYPFVTPRTRAMLAAAGRHHERTGRILLADILAAERAAGERVVTANDHWTAFVPAAARWPFEVHVVPHRHVLDLPDLSEPERAAFAPLYLDVLGRFERLFGAESPYISAWHQAPVHDPDRRFAHLHLQLTSPQRAPNRLKYLAGSESAMGAFINDVRPEEAAQRLRQAGAPQ